MLAAELERRMGDFDSAREARWLKQRGLSCRRASAHWWSASRARRRARSFAALSGRRRGALQGARLRCSPSWPGTTPGQSPPAPSLRALASGLPEAAPALPTAGDPESHPTSGRLATTWTASRRAGARARARTRRARFRSRAWPGSSARRKRRSGRLRADPLLRRARRRRAPRARSRRSTAATRNSAARRRPPVLARPVPCTSRSTTATAGRTRCSSGHARSPPPQLDEFFLDYDLPAARAASSRRRLAPEERDHPRDQQFASPAWQELRL